MDHLETPAPKEWSQRSEVGKFKFHLRMVRDQGVFGRITTFFRQSWHTVAAICLVVWAVFPLGRIHLTFVTEGIVVMGFLSTGLSKAGQERGS